MSDAAFWGCLLLAGGPPVVLYCFVIARQSFLVLLALASAFLWLLVFLLISAVWRGFLPLTSAGELVLVVLLSVSLQEAARFALWKLHRRTCVALAFIAHKKTDTELTEQNKQAMALTHGFAHGVVQSVLFSISWLPLSLGGATYHVPACPSMSYFLASALLSLGFFFLHTASMMLSFMGLEAGDWLLIAAPPALHVAASLLTVANLAKQGCNAVVPTVLAVGLGASAWAGRLWWKSSASGYATLQDTQWQAEP